MPIPIPKKGQTEQEYVSECISQIVDEYGQEQGSAICYNTYRKSKDMSAQSKMASKLRQDSYKGIDLIKLLILYLLKIPCLKSLKTTPLHFIFFIF